MQEFFRQSPLWRSLENDDANAISLSDGKIDFCGITVSSYHASILADFLRRKALLENKTFTFETVMSAADKVALLHEARSRGYRTYLYYVATERPAINIARVAARVAEGGHDVPVNKIVSRYHRSLDLLPAAIRATSRAFLFDTSGAVPWFFAEITEGRTIQVTSDQLPRWFEPIWEQFRW